jgi:type I restriction enzyme M protein
MSRKGSFQTSVKITKLQDLERTIKQIKNYLRKDAGLSTDLERIPLISWLLFLKWLDDWEIKREIGSKEKNETFTSVLEKPYRWRDWSFDSIDDSGEQFLSFMNKNLLPYLASLESELEEDLVNIVGEIFKEIHNPIQSGLILKQVVNEINRIDFNVLEQVHNLAYIYETLLKGLRDAAGNSGEFYTPRPVIRFIVEQLDPDIGNSILDPAVGTGGFLVESIRYLNEKERLLEPEAIKTINKSIFGIEKKSLPYLLCLMNLILHGTPDGTLMKAITRGNALDRPIHELDESIDIIMTNPPFGGEEETSIIKNFPEEGRTNETSILFFQYIMKRLNQNGKCAVIVPNGFLFSDGAASYVKEQILRNFNLHHIILLPEGVFAPYTSIPTNILFFDKGESTQEIHYIQVPPPASGKKFSKTNPIHERYFTSVKNSWDSREETKSSWIVPVKMFHNNNYDLSPQNPTQLTLLQKSMYRKTVNEIQILIKDLLNILVDLQQTINVPNKEDWEYKSLSDLVIEVSNERKERVVPSSDYVFLGVSGEAKGAFKKEPIQGNEIKATNVYRVEAGDLVYNRLFAWKGSFSHIPISMNHCYVSNEFPIFKSKDNLVSTNYLSFYMSHPRFWAEAEQKSRGSTPGSRNRLHQKKFLNLNIPIPKEERKEEIESKIGKLLIKRKEIQELRFSLTELLEEIPKQMVLEVFQNCLQFLVIQ